MRGSLRDVPCKRGDEELGRLAHRVTPNSYAPESVAHHGAPVVESGAHSLYSVPSYMKGNAHGSLFEAPVSKLRPT
jgi:hypothetical protein|eukprot:COSAG02_NODE_3564_length_6552_cov_5.292112_3_plen_76_part_00